MKRRDQLILGGCKSASPTCHHHQQQQLKVCVSTFEKGNVFIYVFILICFFFKESTTGWDWTGSGKNSIDILDELAPVRTNLTGVDIAPGPYSISPALYFTGELILSFFLFGFDHF